MDAGVMGRIQRALDASPMSVGYPVTREDVALLLAEAERLRVERDAVIGMLIQESKATDPCTYEAVNEFCVLLPRCGVLGGISASWAWFNNRAAAVAAVRAAAGLKEGE